MAEGIRIGRLENLVQKWAAKVDADECVSHRNGAGCSHHSEPSHVRVRIGGRQIKFMANGYGSLDGSELGGLSATWTEMKYVAERKLGLSPNTLPLSRER